MSVERKQLINEVLREKGFKTEETKAGIMVRGEGKNRKNPMEGKSRHLVTIGGINEDPPIKLINHPDGIEPDLPDNGREKKPLDMKLGSILTREQEDTERTNWDTYGKECRETSDKYDAENGIC